MVLKTQTDPARSQVSRVTGQVSILSEPASSGEWEQQLPPRATRSPWDSGHKFLT